MSTVPAGVSDRWTAENPATEKDEDEAFRRCTFVKKIATLLPSRTESARIFNAFRSKTSPK
jgi:hypothetical protein